MKKWLGIIMLFMTAFIWGTAFVAQSVGMDFVGPFTFNFSRYVIGSAVLIPFVIISLSNKKKKGTSEDVSKEKGRERRTYIKYTITGGIVCGILLCVASSFQQFGILFAVFVRHIHFDIRFIRIGFGRFATICHVRSEFVKVVHHASSFGDSMGIQ